MNSRSFPGILAILGVSSLAAPQTLAQHSFLPSDLPTDYILWGLPGAGAVQGLSWNGCGHARGIVPAPDDSYGMQLTLHLHAGPARTEFYLPARYYL
ncbi:MAG: hypothetical protein LAN84_11125 [Acidobacteriia bacterium]|nr:hypothetical protein [Terriglobia bacterium]